MRPTPDMDTIKAQLKATWIDKIPPFGEASSMKHYDRDNNSNP